MLRNYLLLALRNLRRHKGYAALTIGGLAVGVACCLLIGLYLRDELSFDRHHSQADRVYRVSMHVPSAMRSSPDWAVTLAPMGPILQEQIPAIEAVTRWTDRGETLVQSNDRAFYEDRFLYADSAAFAVFDLPLLRGDPTTALTRPQTVLLSASTAQRYFGTADPVGEVLTLNTEEAFEVTGVFEDVPRTSHIQADFLASNQALFAGESWSRPRTSYTYLLLRPGADLAQVEAAMQVVNETQFKPQRDIAERLDLTVLTDIRLFGRFDNDIQPQGDIRYVYLFAAIALLVLLIACINYMNLATARSARRAREVGVRKAVGANRRQLIYQFLGEAVLISLMAVGLGLVLVQASTPLFEQLIGRELGSLYDHVGWLVAVGGLVMAVGLLAGSYPALYLSRFRPSTVLKGRTRTAGWSRVRQALVVVQFAASCALIACTAVIQQQMRYVQSERLGFDKEQLVVIPTFDELGTQASAFRAELLRQAGVERVSLGYGLPGERRMAISFYSAEDIEDYEAPEDEHVAMDAAWVDAYYLETLGLRLVQGRSFEAFAGADSARVAVVNETAVRRLGWSEPLGKEIDGLRVVGVVEDYHVGSFRDAVEPTLIEFDPAASTHAAVRLSGGDIRATLARLEAVWDTFVPGRPFQHSFMADELEALYRADLRLGRLFAAFAGVAILIACLGFVGLAAFTAEQRTKEIGIRKVLGASVAGIVALLAKDYARLVVLSVVIAVPLAYFAMDRWLEAFAYRVSISPGTFVGVSLVVLGAALLSVGYQSIRAALTDPARSLRYE